MMSKKAQTLSFIIIIIISAIAIVGIFLGTTQVWKSMACAMGIPLTRSFAPHLGNLQSRSVLLDVAQTATFSDNCQNGSLCYTWTLNITYNGRTSEPSGNITVVFKTKPKQDEISYGAWGPSRYSSEKIEVSPGMPKIIPITTPYLNAGVTIGARDDPSLAFTYTCTEGSYLTIEVSSDSSNDRAVFENQNGYTFCFLPTIIISYSDPTFTAVTDIPTDCWYARVTNMDTEAAVANLQPMVSVDYLSHTATRTQNGAHYFICIDRMHKVLSQTWWRI